MLNWAARYFPILRLLKERLAETDSLLEVGSGAVGIGKYYRRPFVGCDLSFSFRPKAPMVPLIASGTNLPFTDRSFDAVVASDVLEHVPPELRSVVIQETLRVARKIAIFGFPSGQPAFEYDLKLAEAYDRSPQERPVWLEEHLRYQPFPSEALFENLGAGWMVNTLGNESVGFHTWVIIQEMHNTRTYFFKGLLRTFPRAMESLLRLADHEPYYRKIVVLRRA